jgi:hypothetical protein
MNSLQDRFNAYAGLVFFKAVYAASDAQLQKVVTQHPILSSRAPQTLPVLTQVARSGSMAA